VPAGPVDCPRLGSGQPAADRGSECAIFAGDSEQFHAGANIICDGEVDAAVSHFQAYAQPYVQPLVWRA